jgi:hypothetical protein
MKRVVMVAVLALLASCQSSPVGFLDIEGWLPVDDASSCGPEGLWEVINGGADTFLSYGFEQLTLQNFTAGDVIVTVFSFDMGTPLNAFGIYRTENPEDVAALPIGVEAVVSAPYQCLLLKDRYYVKVDAYEGDIDEETGSKLVEAIAAALPGSNALPPEFAALPLDGMVAGTARYTKQDLYGLAELDECAHAAYRDATGSEFEAFVVLPPDGGSVDALWSELESRWDETEVDGRPALYREVPYSGLVGVVRSDSGLLGVAKSADEDQLRQRLALLRASD